MYNTHTTFYYLKKKGVFQMAKKRVNIYVDEDVYAEFKEIVKDTGETITSVVDHSMKEYIKAIKMLREAGNKDALMDMMRRRFDIQVDELEKDITAHVKAKKDQ